MRAKTWIGTLTVSVILISGSAWGDVAGKEPVRIRAAFFNDAAKVQRRAWGLRMQEEIDEIKALCGLSAAQVKTLEEAAGPIIEICLEAWVAKVEEGYRQPGEKPDVELFLEAGLGSRERAFVQCLRPTAHPQWLDLLNQVLSAEKRAVLEQSRTAQNKLIKAQIDQYWGFRESFLRDALHPGLEAKVSALKRELSLEPARATAIDALAEKAFLKMLAADRECVVAGFGSMKPDQREGALTLGWMTVVPRCNDDWSADALWRDGLSQILSPAEATLWQSAEQQRRSRTANVLSGLLVANLDEEIGFSASQRAKLQPLLEAWIMRQSEFVELVELTGQTENNLLATAAGVEGLADILDGLQLKAWRAVCLGIAKGLPGNQLAGSPAMPAWAGESEPEDVEIEISHFLAETAAGHFQDALAELTRGAEDISRVVGADPGLTAKLQNTARAVVVSLEEGMAVSLESMARTALVKPTLENVRRQLLDVPPFCLDNRITDIAKLLWRKAFQPLLTPAQKLRWEETMAERSAYRVAVSSSLVVAEYDRQFGLSADQARQLQPLVLEVVVKYAEVMSAARDPDCDQPWYLVAKTRLTPLIGVPAAQLKAIFAEGQWEQFTKPEWRDPVAEDWNKILEEYEKPSPEPDVSGEQ